MAIRAVIFGLDETLFDRTASLRDFVADQITRHPKLHPLDPGAVINRFLELDRRGHAPEAEVYLDLLAEFELDDADLAAALFADYEENVAHFAKPFPGLSNMFEDLAARRLNTAIVTNGQNHIQLPTLRALGLDKLIDTYLISESEGVRKPEPEIFRRAARQLGVASDECLFVGDDPEADILGAQTLGMTGVWFPNGATWPDGAKAVADAKITGLADITALLDRLA